MPRQHRNPLTRTLMGARRAKDILGVLFRYGFEDVLHEIGLDKVLHEGLRRLHLRRDERFEPLPQAVRLRKALEELGPTFVKLGQILSVRPDLIPVSWATEFRRLQDDVAPVPFEAIEKMLASEFPDGVNEVFASIDPEPLAAGSIAQVHRGVLKGGEHVVLKVLRPDVESVIESDMEILRLLAEFAEDHFANQGYSPTQVVSEFARELAREVDLAREARNTERFIRAFEDQPEIQFPRVYHKASTQRVLTMAFMQGKPLSSLAPDAMGRQERETFVRNAATAVFKQCLVDGFFHADPHPGNLFVLEGGAVGFIDCGMVGHIESGMIERLATLVHGAVSSDVDMVIDATLAIVHGDPGLAESGRFRADVLEMVERFDHASLADIRMGAFLEDFFARIREHHLQCPSDIVFLLKALATVEGVGERYAPDFDVMGHIKPFVEELVRRQYGYRALRRRAVRTFMDYAGMAERLPRNLGALIWELRRNKLHMTLEHQGLDKITHEIEKVGSNLSHAILVSALIMGSAMLMLASRVGDQEKQLFFFLGMAGLIAAAVLVAVRIVRNWFR